MAFSLLLNPKARLSFCSSSSITFVLHITCQNNIKEKHIYMNLAYYFEISPINYAKMKLSTILPEMLLRRTSRMVWPSLQWSSLRLTKLINRRSGWTRMSEILDSSLLKLERLFLRKQNKLNVQIRMVIKIKMVIASNKF